MTDPKAIGLYLHVPFCEKKCAYCDFYSSFVTEDLLDAYEKRLIRVIYEWGGRVDRPIRTVYFGGGTPSLLGRRLPGVMQAVREAFALLPQAEITLEMNPGNRVEPVLENARKAGVNRLSIGAQSGDDQVLALLGRRHTAADTLFCVAEARKAGFHNLSLDLMLGLPHSTRESLRKDAEFLLAAAPEHLSAYLLKIEPNTLFARKRAELLLPDEDEQAEQYLLLCEILRENGWRHYEISNFCREGFESRHNIIYWRDEEYLGIGPSAHSFLNGKRFYYPRDLRAFLKGNRPLPDGEGGGWEEYIMLALRLKEGLVFSRLQERFGKRPGAAAAERLAPYRKAGLLTLDERSIALTERGMLVSNSLITEILNILGKDGEPI